MTGQIIKFPNQKRESETVSTIKKIGEFGFESKVAASLYIPAMVAGSALCIMCGLPAFCMAVAGAYWARDIRDMADDFQHIWKARRTISK